MTEPTAPQRAGSFWDGFLIGVRASVQQPGLAIAFVIVTLALAVAQGGLVWLLREVLRRFAAEHGASGLDLALAAGTILGIWIGRAALAYHGEVLSMRIAYHAEVDGMRRVLAKLLTLSPRFFDQNSQGDLIMASYFDLKGVRTVTMDVGAVVLCASRMLGLGAVAYMISPQLALIGLVAVPLGALPAHWFGQRMTDAAHAERATVTSLYDGFLQITSGIRSIKVNRAEARMIERVRMNGAALYHHLVSQTRSRSQAKLMLEGVSGFGLIAVLIVGGRDVAAGTLDWQSLMSVLIAVMSLYGPIGGLLQVYSRVRTVIPNLERVERIMSAVPEIQDAASPHPLAGPPAVIELENLTFGYGAQPTLTDVSVSFRRGETIGVVGPSGAGKSTLLALLLRFYDPTAGRILFDGVDLRDIRYADLMDRCAIVLQEPFVITDTIANNIRIARPDASMDEVIAAAQAANIHDEIMQMEGGYETLLGRAETGRGISVGQKQRICIAAALLKNAPLLFLDEATSNLDSVSERTVQHAVERLMDGRTTFMVAHRLSTLRRADRILVFDEGALVGFGTHDALLADCETYQRLWSHQSIDGILATSSSGSACLPSHDLSSLTTQISR